MQLWFEGRERIGDGEADPDSRSRIGVGSCKLEGIVGAIVEIGVSRGDAFGIEFILDDVDEGKKE